MKASLNWLREFVDLPAERRRVMGREAHELLSAVLPRLATAGSGDVLSGIIGPTSDAYAPETQAEEREAERYHARQIEWLAATDVDMITATTFPPMPAFRLKPLVFGAVTPTCVL